MLVLVLVGAMVYWYQSTARQCPAPISYRIEEIDPAFGLSKEQALAYVEQAEFVWESQVDRELFRHVEPAAVGIRFIYDDRQANANSEASQRQALDEQLAESEKVQETITDLRAKYESLSADYEHQADKYEEHLRRYNEEVNGFNDRGGAPPEEYERLEAERIALNEEGETLNQVSAELRALVDDINELAERGTQLVNAYNERVSVYNESFGFAHEFTQGDYQSGEINVYKFSSDAEVVTVLAHEFGHALGIGHVEGTTSLMYYLLSEGTEGVSDLSVEDQVAFMVVCGDSESFAQKIRRMIRETLSIFT
jgi:hypothetical protein